MNVLKFPFLKQKASFLMATASIALLAGCAANVDGNATGAIPGAYEKRHPILVDEQPTVFDVPVGMEKTHLTRGAKSALHGFVDDFKSSGARTIQILVPSGSANEGAAAHMAKHLFDKLVSFGVGANKIVPMPYQVEDSSQLGNIRLVFKSIKAHVPTECGQWPEDLGRTETNGNYYNFGCATQKNIAAMIADPNDLLHPRRSAPINPGRRDVVVDNFIQNGSPAVDSAGGFTPGS